MKSMLKKCSIIFIAILIVGLNISGCGEKAPKESALNRIDSLMQAAIQDHAFPGAAVAIGRGSKLIKLQGYGHFGYQKKWNQAVTPNTLFDLASLTKVIATTTAIMQLYEEGKIQLEDKVIKYLPKFAKNGKADITIRQLLSHSSGLKPDVSIRGVTSGEVLIDSVLTEKMTYEPDTKSVYSDSNFILLAMIVEQVSGQKFATYCKQHIFKPLGMTHTGFIPYSDSDTTHTYFEKTGNTVIVNETVDTTNIVPTADHANNLFWGVVNDPRSQLTAGVAGHAGLYSSAEDLAKIAFMYLHQGKVNGKQFLKASTINLFTKDYGVPNSNRALGWEVAYEDCSCGKYFGPKSFGHTGYTGTMIWFDPQQDLFGILLTNQVFPNGHGTKVYAVRQKFENLVYTSLVDSSETQRY